MQKRLKQQEWEAIIEAWRASGKSATAWCRENNFNYTTFIGWSSRLRQSSKQASINSPFIELQNSSPERCGITLEYEGISIKISPGFDQITLNQCLEVLRGKYASDFCKRQDFFLSNTN